MSAVLKHRMRGAIKQIMQERGHNTCCATPISLPLHILRAQVFSPKTPRHRAARWRGGFGRVTEGMLGEAERRGGGEEHVTPADQSSPPALRIGPPPLDLRGKTAENYMLGRMESQTACLSYSSKISLK